jgi:hypothetical protein
VVNTNAVEPTQVVETESNSAEAIITEESPKENTVEGAMEVEPLDVAVQEVAATTGPEVAMETVDTESTKEQPEPTTQDNKAEESQESAKDSKTEEAEGDSPPTQLTQLTLIN